MASRRSYRRGVSDAGQGKREWEASGVAGLICTSFTSGIKGCRLGSLRPEKVMLAVAKQRLRGLV